MQMTTVRSLAFEPVIGQNIPAVWVVRDRWVEIPGTSSIHIIPVGGDKFVFAPGQFCMVYIPGVGDAPISISSIGPNGNGIVLTVRSVGKVSEAICSLDLGAQIGIRGPLGNGWPVELLDGRDILAIAGGLGAAPLRPAFKSVLEEHLRTARNYFLYGSRTPDTILFLDDIGDWNARKNTEVVLTVDHAEPGWSGNVGLVTGLLTEVEFDPGAAIAFVCGPEVMMRFTALELTAIGMPTENIYVSLERNMHCGIGLCGHCQLGGNFICTDGPVFRYSNIEEEMKVVDR